MVHSVDINNDLHVRDTGQNEPPVAACGRLFMGRSVFWYVLN